MSRCPLPPRKAMELSVVRSAAACHLAAVAAHPRRVALGGSDEISLHLAGVSGKRHIADLVVDGHLSSLFATPIPSACVVHTCGSKAPNHMFG